MSTRVVVQMAKIDLGAHVRKEPFVTRSGGASKGLKAASTVVQRSKCRWDKAER